LGEAVALYFLNGLNYRTLARKMDIDRERAYVLVDAGLAWVAEC